MTIDPELPRRTLGPLVALKAFSRRASQGLVHEVQQLAFSVRVLRAYFRHLLQELRA